MDKYTIDRLTSLQETGQQCADRCEGYATCTGFSKSQTPSPKSSCDTKAVSVAGGQTLSASAGNDWYEKVPIETKVTIKINKPLREYVCVWAETIGGVRKSKKIDLEICGTEEVQVTGSILENIPYEFKSRDTVIDGWTYRTYDLNPLRSRFAVVGSTCTISDWEIYDSTGTSLHALDTPDLKIVNNV